VTTYKRVVISEHFVNSGREVPIEPSHSLPGEYNYLHGSDPSTWHTGARAYSQLTYRNVWPHIDVVLKIVQQRLEQEFIVWPGGNPALIRLAWDGVDAMKLNADGSMTVSTMSGVVRQEPPHTFQQRKGRELRVRSRFQPIAANLYGFQIGKYNSKRPLIIDPPLLYSTYLGGTGDEYGGIAVDSTGAAYIGGITSSPTFPTSTGAYETSCPSPCSAGFVTKLNATGSGLIYSTLILGAGIAAIGVNSAGEAFITGRASSSSFPITPNAYQSYCYSGAFVSKLNATGTGLLYSSCFGGTPCPNCAPRALTVDSQGKAYIAGNDGAVGGVPSTANAYHSTNGGGMDALVSVVDTSLSGSDSLVYSTHLGGPGDDFAWALAVDTYGKIYVGGETHQPDGAPSFAFPVTPNA
jgi:hypothetical protein